MKMQPSLEKTLRNKQILKVQVIVSGSSGNKKPNCVFSICLPVSALISASVCALWRLVLFCGASFCSVPPHFRSVLCALRSPLSALHALLCTLRSLQQCGTEQGTSHVTERRTVEQWSGGAVAQWSGGAVEQWSSEAVKQWRSGAAEQWSGKQWRNGAVERWHSGAVERKSETAMERWKTRMQVKINL